MPESGSAPAGGRGARVVTFPARTIPERSEDGGDSILFSVIIPTHDRPAGLARCLDALIAQEFDRATFEIVVVDDGGKRGPREIIAARDSLVAITLLTQANAGPAAARNAGARVARGRFLAFTDDDCAPSPGWLSVLARVFEKSPESMFGGLTRNCVDRNAYADVSQALVSYLYEYYNDDGDVRFLTSNNMAMPADRFRALGGFSARFPRAAAEDRDLCERWLRAGHLMSYAPDAIVDHHHTLTLRSFWRQHFNYGRGAHGFHVARATRGYGRLRIEPLRFYVGLVGHPITRNRSLRGVQHAALMALTQIANAAGFFYEALVWRGTDRRS
ncbi:MAG: glycosyltransferase family 2 protein [Longimicrobiales bacterium]